MHKGRHCRCWRTKVLGGTRCKGQGSLRLAVPGNALSFQTAEGVLMESTSEGEMGLANQKQVGFCTEKPGPLSPRQGAVRRTRNSVNYPGDARLQAG